MKDSAIDEIMALFDKTWEEAIDSENVFKNAPTKLYYYRRSFMVGMRRKMAAIADRMVKDGLEKLPLKEIMDWIAKAYNTGMTDGKQYPENWAKSRDEYLGKIQTLMEIRLKSNIAILFRPFGKKEDYGEMG